VLPGARSDAASTTIELPAVVDWAVVAPAADEEQAPDGTMMSEQAASDAATGRDLPVLENCEAAAGQGRQWPTWRPRTRNAEGRLQRAAWRNQGLRFRVLACGAGSEHVRASRKAWNRLSLTRN
jgi:hypothetical protein